MTLLNVISYVRIPIITKIRGHIVIFIIYNETLDNIKVLIKKGVSN